MTPLTIPTKENPATPFGARGNNQNSHFHYSRRPTAHDIGEWEAIEAFRTAMREAGIEPPEQIEAGRIIRFPGAGKRRSNRSAWCFLFSDCRGGAFGDFSAGIEQINWKLAQRGLLSSIERNEFRRKADQARRKSDTDRATRQEAKAREAAHTWAKAAPCTCHPYLVRKCVASHGLRTARWWTKRVQTTEGRWKDVIIKDVLVIPMYDRYGALWNLQAIFAARHPDLGRDKDFLGGRKHGLFFVIGDPTSTIQLCEGYATAATCHRLTGHQTIVAFDCGNLVPVAKTVRAMYPKARIILCADNDRHTEGNPGITHAREAAIAVKGLISIPQFPDDVPGTDWNDLTNWQEGTGYV